MRSDFPCVLQDIFRFVYIGNIDIDNAHVLLTFSTHVFGHFSVIFGTFFFFRNFHHEMNFILIL